MRHKLLARCQTPPLSRSRVSELDLAPVSTRPSEEEGRRDAGGAGTLAPPPGVPDGGSSTGSREGSEDALVTGSRVTS